MTRGPFSSNSNLDRPANGGAGGNPLALSGSGSESGIQTVVPRPLAVILSSSGQNSIEPGNTFFIGVTVSNRSPQNITTQVFIDNLPPLLRQWCDVSQEYLALAPGQSGEVVFQLRVPIDALPATYSYLVVVDAPDQDYPPSYYPQQLQILPSSQEVSSESDPTFVIQPLTTAAAPALLERSGSLPVQVQVYNRSDRVDRFRLRCPDLPSTWFTIDYPRNQEGIGLVVEADSLRLNPGDQGQILFILHPPHNAPAGRYEPTLQLLSENDPRLGLLDVVYFQIQPDYALQPTLQTLVGRIGSQAGLFELWLNNSGNTDRHLLVHADDADEGSLCTHTLIPNPITVVPQTTGLVQLKVQPNKWWKRPWIGGGKVINLRVTLIDQDQRPLPNAVLQSILVWSPRPWWQVWPLILLALGAVGLLIWALWWLLFRPPVLPSIPEFFAEDARYAASDGDTVRVGWTIENPRRIRNLRLVGRSPDGLVISGPLDYEFSGNTLPPGLDPFCTLEADLLQCRNVLTDARQAGTYVFELTLTPRGRRRNDPISSQSDPVVISPVPQPVVTQIAAGQPMYQEVPLTDDGAAADTTGEITLNWTVENPENLEALVLQGRTGDGSSLGEIEYRFVPTAGSPPQVPPELQPFCQLAALLECQGIPTGIRQAGDYTFELIARPIQPAAEPPEPVASEVVKVAPVPPLIASFLVNGEEAQAKYLIPVDQGQPPPVMELAWDVIGGSSTTVELTPAPGSVPLQGALTLPLSQQPGSSLVTLQVSNSAGQTVTRSVTFETFDPTPTDPVAAAAEAIAAATADSEESSSDSDSDSDSGSASGLGTPTLSVPDTLSPTETPPQFD